MRNSIEQTMNVFFLALTTLYIIIYISTFYNYMAYNHAYGQINSLNKNEEK